MLRHQSALSALALGVAAALIAAAPTASGARQPRYAGTITVGARESAPGAGIYSAYEYTGNARLPFSFSGSGHLRSTSRRTARISGTYTTMHGTSDYRICKGPDESGALRGTIVYSVSPVVLAKSVTLSFTDLGETMTPNYRTVCGLPQAQAGGAHTLGLLGYSIEAAEGKALQFAFPVRGGTRTWSGRLRNTIPSDRTVRTYTVTVKLVKVG